MKWFAKGLIAIVLISLLTSALLVGAATAFGTPFDHATIQIDDASLTLGELTAGHWLIALAGIALACAVVMVVVPLAVLVPLALAAFGIVVALTLTTAALAVVCSPLILIGWLLWVILTKRSSQDQSTAAVQR